MKKGFPLIIALSVITATTWYFLTDKSPASGNLLNTPPIVLDKEDKKKKKK